MNTTIKEPYKKTIKWGLRMNKNKKYSRAEVLSIVLITLLIIRIIEDGIELLHKLGLI